MDEISLKRSNRSKHMHKRAGYECVCVKCRRLRHLKLNSTLKTCSREDEDPCLILLSHLLPGGTLNSLDILFEHTGAESPLSLKQSLLNITVSFSGTVFGQKRHCSKTVKYRRRSVG